MGVEEGERKGYSFILHFKLGLFDEKVKINSGANHCIGGYTVFLKNVLV
jgi:hypothetical protein